MNNKTLELLLENGIIAISRGIYGEKLIAAVAALYDGGVRAVEVTFEQTLCGAETVTSIKRLREAFGGTMAIGAGTVMSLPQLAMAHEAGAEYIVSPNTDEEVIRKTKKLGLISIPGAMTPSEIASAAGFGADIVKVFPAGALGTEYFSAVTTPLAHIKCAAVGGVTLDNIAQFKRCGACAFGISSSLFDKKLIESDNFAAITQRAAAFAASVINA